MIRKLLITSAVLAALAVGPVTAQEEEAGITFGAWGRGAFSPLILMGETQQPKPGSTSGETEPADGTDWVGAGAAGTWGGANGFITDFEVKGVSQYIGFGIGLEFDSSTNLGFNALGVHGWVRPLGNDMLKIYAGRFADDSLRGKIGALNNGFSNFVMGSGFGEEDSIFQRFNQRMDFFGQVAGGVTQGFMISSRPIDPLFIGLSVTAPLWNAGAGNNGDWVWNPRNAANVYRTTQVGVGYEIEGVGLVRAQFLGGFVNIDYADGKFYNTKADGTPNPDYVIGEGGPSGDFGMPNNGSVFLDTDGNVKADMLARIEAAFAFTGMQEQGLLIDLGLKYYLPLTLKNVGATDTTATNMESVYNHGFNIQLGGTYQQDAIRVKTMIGLTGLGRSGEITGPAGYSDKTTYGPNFEFSLVPAYAIGDNSWIGLDIGLKAWGAEKNEVSNTGGTADPENKGNFRMGFGAFFEQGFTNGMWKVGLAYTLPTTNDGNNRIDLGGMNTRGVFSVPVVLEYFF